MTCAMAWFGLAHAKNAHGCETQVEKVAELIEHNYQVESRRTEGRSETMFIVSPKRVVMVYVSSLFV